MSLGGIVTTGVVVLIAVCLLMAAATAGVVLGKQFGDGVYRRTRLHWYTRHERRERRELLRQARALQYIELTGSDVTDWCELSDDGTDV